MSVGEVKYNPMDLDIMDHHKKQFMQNQVGFKEHTQISFPALYEHHKKKRVLGFNAWKVLVLVASSFEDAVQMCEEKEFRVKRYRFREFSVTNSFPKRGKIVRIF